MALIDREAVKKVFEDFGKPLVMAPGFAARQIDAIPAIDRWISASDRLPNDTEKVLVYTTTSNTTVARWSQRQEKFVASGHITVTH